MQNRAPFSAEQKLLPTVLTQDFIKKGIEYLDAQDFITALKCFEKATTTENQSLKYNALAYLELTKGRQFFYSMEYLLALKAYAVAIQIIETKFPNEKEAISKLYAYKGQAFYAQSEHANLSDNSEFSQNWERCYKTAYQYDSKAMILKGELTYVVNYVYHHLLRLKQPQKDKHYHKIDDSSKLFAHAQCMWKGAVTQGRYNEQIKHYQEAVKHYPNNPSAWLECGLARLKKSEQLVGQEWKACLETAIADFNHIDSLVIRSLTSFYRGIAYSKLQDYVSAYSNLMRGIVLDLKMTNNEIEVTNPSLPEVRTAILQHLALSQKELTDTNVVLNSLEQKYIPLYEKLNQLSNKIVEEHTNSELYFEKANIWEELSKLDLASYDYGVAVWLLENNFASSQAGFKKIFYYYGKYAVSLLNRMEKSYQEQDFQKGFDEFLFFMNTVEKFELKKHFVDEIFSNSENHLDKLLIQLENQFTKRCNKDLHLKKVEFNDMTSLQKAIRQFIQTMGESQDHVLGQFVRNKIYPFLAMCKNYCKEILISLGDANADKNPLIALKFYDHANKILSGKEEKRIKARIQIIFPPVNILELFLDLRHVLEERDLTAFENHVEKFLKELHTFLDSTNSEAPVQAKSAIQNDECKPQKQTLVIMRSVKGYHGRSGMHIFKDKNRINIKHKIKNIQNLLHEKKLDNAEKELCIILEKFKEQLLQIRQKDFSQVISLFQRYILGIFHQKASDIIDVNEEKGAVYFKFLYTLIQTKPYFAGVKKLLDDSNYSLASFVKIVERERKPQLKELKPVVNAVKIVKNKNKISSEEKAEPSLKIKEPSQKIKEIKHGKIELSSETKAPSSDIKSKEVITVSPVKKNKKKKKSPSVSASLTYPEQKKIEKEQKEPLCIIPNLKINLPDEAVLALKDILAAGGNRAFAVGGIVCEGIKPFKKKTDIDIVFGAANPLSVLQKAFPGAIIKAEGNFYKINRPGQQTLEIWHSEALSDTTLSDTKALKKDAQNRDFTINALYANYSNEVFDPTHRGYKDLNREPPKKPRLKCIIEAKASFAKDPIRILRAVYFSIKREIPLSDYMIKQIKEVDPELFINYIKANPIKTNCWMKKLLCLGDAFKNFDLLMRLELLPKLFQGMGVALLTLVQTSTFIMDNLKKADDLLQKEKYPNLNVIYALWIQLLSQALLKKPAEIIDACLIFKTNFPSDTPDKLETTKQYLREADRVLSAEVIKRTTLQQQSLFPKKSEAKIEVVQQIQMCKV